MFALTIQWGGGRRRRPTLRQIATGVSCLQAAEGLRLHADRDTCLACLIGSTVLKARGRALVPAKYLADKAWMHQHVEMPGVRQMARLDDELRHGAAS